MFNIVVFGAPCSGKGTQSKRIAAKYGLRHLSTGDHFRKEIKNRTELGLVAKSYIDKGSLVPDEIVLKEIYRKAIRNKRANGFVFDGFPRTLQQAQMLDKSLSKKNLRISLAIYIDVDEPELIKRLLKRCKDSGRSDDSVEIIKRRIDIYEKETIPLINYYLNQQKLISVSGMSDVPTVCQRILIGIENFLRREN